MTANNSPIDEELDKILSEKPYDKPLPDGLWESIYATWTGLWIDWHGELDERQASDIFPIGDFLSDEREAWLKAAITAYTQRKIEEAKASCHYNCARCLVAREQAEVRQETEKL